mmetsp:Transcript_19505/g.28727  ORF Transcript_19505/g.28727 Transcript_19505/m.28727 type:complete len:272 (+) Transcript_19505:39-854(+)
MMNKVWSVFALCVMMANGAVVEITDFTSSDNVRDMNTVDDPVMGGSSHSTSTLNPSCCLIWEGTVEEVWFLESPGFCILETSGRQSFPGLSTTSGVSFFVSANKGDMSLLPLTAQITTGSMSVRGRPVTYEGILMARKHYTQVHDEFDDFYGEKDVEGVSLENLEFNTDIDDCYSSELEKENSYWYDDDATVKEENEGGGGGVTVVELYAPWTSFEGTFRGQKVMDAPPLNALELEKTYRIGLSTYASHKAGSFRLELIKIVAGDDESDSS